MKTKKQFQATDRFLPLDVYRNGAGALCGGICNTENTIYIPCETGNYTHADLYDYGKTNLIFIPEQRGPEYWALKPNFIMDEFVGPIYGGHLAYSSDSRCKRIYHIHDRFETPAQYERNSI